MLDSLRPLLRLLGCGFLYFHRPERYHSGIRLAARCRRCHATAPSQSELLRLDPRISLDHPLMADNAGRGRGRA